MNLELEFPRNLSTEPLLTQKDIPCFCKINEKFELVMKYEPFEMTGEVMNWDIKKISRLLPAGAGGEYIYYNHGLVTLENIRDNSYRVIDLKLFDEDLGWTVIIYNKEYSTDYPFE